MDALIKKVENWFFKRNMENLPSDGQLRKMEEEVCELKEAYNTQNRVEEIDAVGDVLVTVIGYCLQNDLDIQKCLNTAYVTIKNRKGLVIGNEFVKEENLNMDELTKEQVELLGSQSYE